MKLVMNALLSFIRGNRTALLGMIAGWIVGYLYWFYFGIYDGTFGFSSEWWTNCVYGSLFVGLIGSLFRK